MSATHTTNLGLNKPNRQDYVSVVTDINDNMDILDSKIGAVPSGETVEGQIGAKVPTTRKINNKALSSDVTIMGSDIPMNSLDNTKLDVAVGDLKSALYYTNKAVTDIDGSIFGEYEIGYVTTIDGDFVYVDQNYRIRTLRGTYLNLKAGDTVESTNSGVQYQLLKYEGGTASSATQYTTNKYTVLADGLYVICAMYTDSRVLSSVDDVLRYLKFYRSSNKLSEIKDDIDEIDTELNKKISDISETTVNLLDASLLVTTGITKSEDVISGTASAFENAYSSGNTFGITFSENTQYTISAKVKNTNAGTTSGSGLRIIIYYTDNTNDMLNIPNTVTTYQLKKITSASGKTISKIGFGYGSGSSNIWHLDELQIEEGVTNTPFVHYLTATDDISRNSIASAMGKIEGTKELIYIFGELENIVWEYGTISSTTGLNSTDSQFFRSSKIIHIKKGSSFKKMQSGITLRAFYYNNNDLAQFTDYEDIIKNNLDEYIFAEDRFARFVIRHNTAEHSIDWANSAIEYKIADADFSNKTVGAEISVLGTPGYLGNAIVIKFPNGKIMGIDCFIAEAQIFINNSYVTDGVLHFDYFQITHYHKDHVGNIPFLIEKGFIDENTIMFLPPDLDTSYDTNIFFDWLDNDGPKAMFENVYPQIVATGCTIIKPTEGQQFNIAGIDLKFFNCDHSIYYPGGAYATRNFNNLSLCCYLTCENYNFCDPGDLGYEGMQRMVALNTLVKANVYNADHHGWENGTASNYYGLLPAYINRISPDIVFSEDYSTHNTLIMTPGSELQSWCEANGVPNYRTAINGNMKFQMNRNGIKLLGGYTRFIRNDKNWSYSDNSEHIET